MPTRALLQRIGFVVLPLYLLSAASAQVPWRTLAPGMDFAYVGPEASAPRIAVLRIDPKLWELDVMSSSRTGETAGHTTREWCQNHKYVAAINAGMFASDMKTHLGYSRETVACTQRAGGQAKSRKHALAPMMPILTAGLVAKFTAHLPHTETR